MIVAWIAGILTPIITILLPVYSTITGYSPIMSDTGNVNLYMCMLLVELLIGVSFWFHIFSLLERLLSSKAKRPFYGYLVVVPVSAGFLMLFGRFLRGITTEEQRSFFTYNSLPLMAAFILAVTAFCVLFTKDKDWKKGKTEYKIHSTHSYILFEITSIGFIIIIYLLRYILGNGMLYFWVYFVLVSVWIVIMFCCIGGYMPYIHTTSVKSDDITISRVFKKDVHISFCDIEKCVVEKNQYYLIIKNCNEHVVISRMYNRNNWYFWLDIKKHKIPFVEKVGNEEFFVYARKEDGALFIDKEKITKEQKEKLDDCKVFKIARYYL